MAFCPHCGTNVTAGSKYCSSCGAAVGDTSDTPTQRIRRPTAESIAVGEQKLLATLRDVTLGEYEVLGEIGRGGMAVVYAAHEIALDRKVAIKVMSPTLILMDAAVQARFQREARTAASLSHPNIIPVYAVRESESIVYFIMKFVSGRSLESVILELGPMPIPMIKTILTQAGSALGYAHRKGVVHRDVKPANIMIDDEGWVVVTDFGIAKVSEGQALTATGGVVGTPAYMSPEQCSGREITGSSDQYSLGVVAFEMLTGRQPFRSGTMVNLLYDHCHTMPPSVSSIRQDCPPELATAVMRMLDKDPENRFATMEEAVTAIGTVSDSQSGMVRTEMLTLAQAGSTAKPFDKPDLAESPVPQHSARTDPEAVTEVVEDGGNDPLQAEDSQRPRARRPIRLALLMLLLVAVPSAVGAWVLFLRPGVENGSDASAGQTAELAADPPATGVIRTVASVTVAPRELVLEVGDTAFVEAVARAADGDAVETTEILWESADAGIVMVVEPGILVATGVGATRVMASAESESAFVGVSVTAPRVASPAQPIRAAVDSVAIEPDSATLLPGRTLQLRAAVLDDRGRVLNGRRITWESSAPQVVAVNASGVVRGLAAGTALVSATSEGGSGSAEIFVSPESVATVEVAAGVRSLEVGDSVQLSVRISGETGDRLDRAVVWESSDPVVASVSPTGMVQANVPGAATVTATAGGLSDAVSLTVREAAEVTMTAPTREEIFAATDAALEEYRQAIESENLGAVRNAYPGMSSEQERSWRDFFNTAEDVQVVFSVLDRSVSEGVVTLRVSARLLFRAAGRQDQTSEFTATFERDAQDWVLIRIE